MENNTQNKDSSRNDGNTMLSIVEEFKNLTSEQQQPYLDLAANVLNGLHCCTRVWESWHIGTMTQHDFVEADFDDELIYDRASIIYDFINGG